MNLLAYSNDVPAFSMTQQESWEVFRDSKAIDRISDPSQRLLQKVLCGNSGIEKRHFANEAISRIFEQDAETLNHVFEREATQLASVSLARSLEKAELRAGDLDALFVCTCTGYLCPGISSYVAQKLGMRSNTYLQDIVGLGCGALIPTLRSGYSFLKSGEAKTIAVVAVEICSAAFYMDEDPGVLISLCIFGDGCSSSIWSAKETRARARIHQFDTLHIPENRELLRFVNTGGKLKNKLHITVPEVSSDAVRRLISQQNASLFDGMISHGGGKEVLRSIEKKIPEYDLLSAKNILSKYGNMSSPSVFFALEEQILANPIQKHFWMTSFGAGFACHGCALDVF